MLYDRGEGRGHPTEDGSEHEQPARPPRVEVYLTHMEVFYLGKVTYVHLLGVLGVVIKSGDKGCFLGVFFALFWGFCEKINWGIFLYGLLYMLCGIYDGICYH